jgi:hypothetical protein
MKPSESVGLIVTPAVSSEIWKIWIWIVAACLGIGGFFMLWHGAMPFEWVIRAFAAKDQWKMGSALASNPVTLRHYYSLSVGLAFLLVGVVCLGAVIWARLNEVVRSRVYDLVFTLTVSCAVMIYLSRMSYEGPWLPLDVIMKHPSALPVYGHRLLFVWIARGFQKIVPGLSDLRGFYLSQWIATVLALYALGKWSALHVGKRFSWAGQILGAVLISTCFGYYNFYDIGTVFFTTCGLIAIFTKRYWWLVPIVMIGTLNYEGLLLLIPVAAFVAYYEEPLKRWLPPVGVSLLGYCTVRFALQAAIPFPHQVNWRVWSNMTDPFLAPEHMAASIMALAGWYVVGLMSVTYCDPRLKRMILLFPLIFGVAFLFGLFHESRLYDAFIPVLVALILSASMRRFELEARKV